jgi:hypothetical protein
MRPRAWAFGQNGNLFVASELGNVVLEYDGTTGAFVGEFVAADPRRSPPWLTVTSRGQERLT